MGSINKDDLKTILSFALHVARVDFELAPMEKNVIKRFIDMAHIDHNEIEDLTHHEFSLAEGLQSLSSNEAKVLLIKTMCAVAFSDGKNRDEENTFIYKVNRQLGDLVDLGEWDDWSSYEGDVIEVLNTISP